MKKIVSLILAVLLIFSCVACGGESVTEAPRASFDGNTTTYTYYFPEESREHDWEEDILYFAEVILINQPYMTKWCNTKYYDQTIPAEQRISSLYDEELRNTFLENINLLIPQVATLSDTEINWELRRIAALLHDGHTGFYPDFSLTFPLFLWHANDENGRAPYVLDIIPEHADFLHARLDAINGVPTDEILARLTSYISSDNEYWIVPSILSSDIINSLDALRIIGVVDEESSTAEYTFTKQDGTQETLTFSAVSYEECSELTFADSGLYDTLHCQSFDVPYWYEYQPDSDLMYVRMNEFHEIEGYTYWDFYKDFLNEVNERSGVEKLVIDLRGNTGGLLEVEPNTMRYLCNHLNNADIGQIYVLMDEKTASASVATAGILKQYVDGLLLVGAPAAETPASILSVQLDMYALPNHETLFQVSKRYCNYWYGYEGDALMPDFTVYQTYEDLVNGVDTVLEAVLNMEATP